MQTLAVNGHAYNANLFNDIHEALMIFMMLLWLARVKCIKLRVKISYSWLHKYQWHAVQLCNRTNNSKYAVNDIHDSSKALHDVSCSQHSGR